jgi:drug/metabolite transporter (DMT)-like permease
LAVFLALLAAAAFAFGTVLQQKGTLQTEAQEGDPRFLVQILRQPVWALGALLQGVGWVLQAVALKHGPLEVVQAVCTLSLVIALPIGVRLTGQRVGRREMLGAVATVGGIVLFLSGGSPQAGTSRPTAEQWQAAGLVTLAVVLALGTLGRKRTGPAAAVLLASAAGMAFAFQGAVTKVFVGQLGQGLHALLATWTPYVLLASAIVGFALQQSALKTGALAPSMAASSVVTLLGSVLLGAVMFGEAVSEGGARLIPAVIGLVLAVAGIIALTEGRDGGAPGAADPDTERAATRPPPGRQT